jgi:hypothetical protein
LNRVVYFLEFVLQPFGDEGLPGRRAPTNSNNHRVLFSNGLNYSLLLLDVWDLDFGVGKSHSRDYGFFMELLLDLVVEGLFSPLDRLQIGLALRKLTRRLIQSGLHLLNVIYK